MDQTLFRARLKSLREEAKLSQEELANKIGVKRSTLAGWEAGTRFPKSKHLSALASVFGVSVDYLIGDKDVPTRGTGDRPKPHCHGRPSTAGRLSDIAGAPERVKMLPIVGRVTAGLLSFAEENIEGQVGVPAYCNLDFALRIKGDSLIGAGIYEGNLVACIRYDGQAVHPGDLVVVTRNDEATIKFLQKDRKGRWVLRAANPKYPDIPLTTDDRIQAIVVTKINNPSEV